MEQNSNPDQNFYTKVERIQSGSTNIKFQNKRYILSKELLPNGKVIKVYAEELGGKDFISFNMYKLKNGWELKPCEMPVGKVVNFIKEMEI
jgi:peptide-methionine (S)-S-oxide reductase